MMPVMSGWDFRRAQREDPELARIPVVVMTAARNVDAEALQADEYVWKPVDVERLLELVGRYKAGALPRQST